MLVERGSFGPPTSQSDYSDQTVEVDNEIFQQCGVITGANSCIVLHGDSSNDLIFPFLGTGQATKTDEFSEKFQTFPPLFSENYVSIFSENVQKAL